MDPNKTMPYRRDKGEYPPARYVLLYSVGTRFFKKKVGRFSSSAHGYHLGREKHSAILSWLGNLELPSYPVLPTPERQSTHLNQPPAYAEDWHAIAPRGKSNEVLPSIRSLRLPGIPAKDHTACRYRNQSYKA